MVELSKEFEAQKQEIQLDRDREIPPIVQFDGVQVCSAASGWGKSREIQIQDELTGLLEAITIRYRTKFDLYVSDSKYYLHKLGESEYSEEETFYSVISFASPGDFSKILSDPNRREIRPSKPIITLIQDASKSKVLSPTEQEKWTAIFVSKE